MLVAMLGIAVGGIAAPTVLAQTSSESVAEEAALAGWQASGAGGFALAVFRVIGKNLKKKGSNPDKSESVNLYKLAITIGIAAAIGFALQEYTSVDMTNEMVVGSVGAFTTFVVRNFVTPIFGSVKSLVEKQNNNNQNNQQNTNQ